MGLGRTSARPAEEAREGRTSPSAAKLVRRMLLSFGSNRRSRSLGTAKPLNQRYRIKAEDLATGGMMMVTQL